MTTPIGVPRLRLSATREGLDLLGLGSRMIIREDDGSLNSTEVVEQWAHLPPPTDAQRSEIERIKAELDVPPQAVWAVVEIGEGRRLCFLTTQHGISAMLQFKPRALKVLDVEAYLALDPRATDAGEA